MIAITTVSAKMREREMEGNYKKFDASYHELPRLAEEEEKWYYLFVVLCDV